MVGGFLPLARSAASVASRLGCADRPVPVVQNTRLAFTASRSISSAVMCHVGCGRLAVEEKGEVVRWEELAEDHRGAQRGVGPHESVVHAEPAQRLADVFPEAIGRPPW